MQLNFPAHSNKTEIFKAVKAFLTHHGFTIVNSDDSRPWGGFYVIDEAESQKFIEFFFKDVVQAHEKSIGKISPKILIVENNKRLSWQYHHRRAEVWKVIGGEVGVITSNDDVQNQVQLKKLNDLVILKQGERHRLIGTENWGIIAEIWQHTDVDNPSDEEDIVRVQDDFGR